VRCERFSSRQHQRVLVDEADRREVLLGIEREIWIERYVGGDLQIVQEQRVAVRRRARDPASSDGGAAAAYVLDHEILLELLGKSRREPARDLIRGSAGRIWDDDRDQTARVILRASGPGANNKHHGENKMHRLSHDMPLSVWLTFSPME